MAERAKPVRQGEPPDRRAVTAGNREPRGSNLVSIEERASVDRYEPGVRRTRRRSARADGNDGRRVPSSVVGALVAKVLPDLGTPAAVLDVLQVSGRGVLHSYSSCESLLSATGKYFVVDSAALFR